MESEIIAGLRNAMERGESLERAMQSFINAGYNAREVGTAGKELSGGGVSNIVESYEVPQNLKQMQNIRSASANIEMKNKGNNKIILLIIVLLVLMIFVGGLIWLMFTL